MGAVFSSCPRYEAKEVLLVKCAMQVCFSQLVSWCGQSEIPLRGE